MGLMTAPDTRLEALLGAVRDVIAAHREPLRQFDLGGRVDSVELVGALRQPGQSSRRREEEIEAACVAAAVGAPVTRAAEAARVSPLKIRRALGLIPADGSGEAAREPAR